MSNGIHGGMTKQLIVAALRRLWQKEGIESVQAALASVDASTVDSINPDNWGRILDLCPPAPAHGQMAARATTHRPTPPSVQDSLTKMGLNLNDATEVAQGRDAGIADDIKSVIEGGETLQDGLNNAARAIHARNKNRHRPASQVRRETLAGK